MTVAQLIERLKEYPLDMEVTTTGYEAGVTSNVVINIIDIERDYYSEWYYGEHLEYSDNPTDTVLNIGR